MTESKLSLRNIRHVYRNEDNTETEAIRSIDLDVEEGEFLAIVGASGCGKTTLLDIMCGMIKPTSGTVLISGEQIGRAHV